MRYMCTHAIHVSNCCSCAQEGGAFSDPDVYLPNWMRGQPAALDVHVISTHQRLTLKEAAVTQGHALSVGEERKSPKLATLWE